MDVKIEDSWKTILKDEFSKPYFSNLVQFVKEEYRCYPGRIFPKGNQIFRAFNECPFDKVKVVILGQDPYPTKGHAHGLCFSAEKGVRPFPKSLQNIFKELESDLGIKKEHPDLSDWAKQGVLLLNTVLTVREGEAGSHQNKGWELFTDAVIEQINQRKKNVVFMLWGSKAQQKAMNVNDKNHLILKTVHPSPLSAHRGFFGCKHFSKANEYLKITGQHGIHW